MRDVESWLFVTLLATLCLFPARLAAQTAEGSDNGAIGSQVELARETFSGGSRRAEQGDWTGALTAYENALRLFPHATTQYNIGFCHAQLGALATAYYLIALALEGSEFDEARRLTAERRTVASAELEHIRAALAQITLATGAHSLTLRIDGETVCRAGPNDAAPLVACRIAHASHRVSVISDGAVIYLDPGKHDVELKRGSITQRVQVELAEGETQNVTWNTALLLPEHPPATARSLEPRPESRHVGSSKSAAPRATNAPTPPSHAKSASRLLRSAGFGCLATGGTGFVLAAVSGLVTANANSELYAVCSSDGSCPKDKADAVERYRTAAHLTNLGLAIGVVGSVVGITLLVVDSSRESRTNVSLGVTPSELRVLGNF